MPETTPSLEQWTKLYSLMAQIEQLAPWEWMREDAIFGVQMPGTEESGFISVMGTLGEHFSIAVYQGIKGLDGFWQMEELGDRMTPKVLLQIPQLQASFEDRSEITDKDREITRKLGLKFRGAKAWPQFRSFRPGCMPWYIEKEEAEMLTCALEQVLDVAPRYKKNRAIFPKGKGDYLVRVQRAGIWEDTTLRIAPYEGTALKLKMNKAALERLKKMMPGKAVIEVDVFMVNNPVQDERKARPFFPYMLLICDHDSGIILATDLLKPLPALEAMWEDVPAKTVEVLARSMAPKEIMVRNDLLKSLLGPVGAELGCKVTKSARLAAIDSARKELNRFL